MSEREIREPGSDWPVGRLEAAESVISDLVTPGWRGRLNELEPIALEVFWRETLAYARWEIGRYGRWRDLDEPVLASGYDAEGVVQAAFERLVRREAGGEPRVYTVEELRHELRSQVKHRVRWLHERAETGLMVSEWDVLPPTADGERLSIFDYLPGKIARPDQELMGKERDKLKGEFKAGFEKTLGERAELSEVFRRVWDGEKRREIAQRLGTGTERVKSLQRQIGERLAKFAASARDGIAEMLQGRE